MKFFTTTVSSLLTTLVFAGALFLVGMTQSAFAQTGMSNYIVDSVSITPTIVRVGESPIQITATVRNTGTASGGTSTQTIMYIDRTSSLSNAYEQFSITNDLPAGGSETETFTFNQGLPLNWYPNAGTHTVIVCANTDSIVAESDFSDNCSAPKLFTISSVDYIPVGLSLSPNPATPGSVATFSWKVQNRGIGDAGTETHSRLRVDWGNDGTWDYTFGNTSLVVPPLTSQEIFDQAFSLGSGPNMLLQLGRHKVQVCADAPLATASGVNYADNLPDLMESSEGNNCQQLIFQVSDPVPGCMDASATNYNASATQDDGSCTYPPDPVPGCMDINAMNYNPSATQDDGTCTYPPVPVPGCMDTIATNYDVTATVDDGTCNYAPTQCIDTPARVSGFAWSDMPDGSDECIVGQNAPCLSGGNMSNLSSGRGAGWISMSGTAQDGTSYTVSVDNQGNFSGYAWSNPSDDVANPPTSNIGWIDFSPSGPFPSGSGTTASPAKIDMQLDGNGNVTGSGQWSGWIRVTSPMNDPNAGGWDGWISLRGNGYGVQTDLSTGVTTGHAWGDAVIGWVDFGKTIVTPPKACVDIPPPPPKKGCMDPLASNYNPSARVDDGSCEYDNPVEVCNGVDDDNDGEIDEGLDCEDNPQSCVVPSLSATTDTCKVSWSAQNFAGASCAVISQTGVTVATGGVSDQKTLQSNGSYIVQCTKNGLRVSESVSVSGCK